MDIGWRISVLRQRARLTQAGLARKVGVGRSTVFRWETGDRTPSLAQIPRLAEALGLTESQFWASKLSRKPS